MNESRRSISQVAHHDFLPATPAARLEQTRQDLEQGCGMRNQATPVASWLVAVRRRVTAAAPGPPDTGRVSGPDCGGSGDRNGFDR